MSGHSKWSKVKHQKSGTDAAKGSAFTKASRAISVAVKEGSGIIDPEKNFRLRLAFEKARAVNMPKETIDRAIAKAVGEGAAPLDTAIYEAIGPGGSALVIEAATDNRQRTVSEIKNVLDRYGGRLCVPGAVLYQFQKVGYISLPKISGKILDQMMEIGLDAGADDVLEDEDVFEVYTKPDQLASVKQGLMSQGIAMEESSLIFRPTIEIHLDEHAQQTMDKLLEHLYSLDDVQEIYSNVV